MLSLEERVLGRPTMGWSDCGVNPDTGDKMGYAHSGVCAQEGCDEKIDHGLAYVCGDMHEGGEHGCGRYFCYSHLFFASRSPREQLCEACVEALKATDSHDV